MNYRNNDHNNYSMNMNFPPLGKANPSGNFQGSMGQNMNLQKNANVGGHPGNEPPGFSQNPSINFHLKTLIIFYSA